MTDLEKLEARLVGAEVALTATKNALTIDRKMSHDKKPNGHYTTALTELTNVVEGLKNLKVRIIGVGH